MNPIVVAIVAWLCFGLELGLRDLLAFGPHGIAPSFVLPLVAFLGLTAPPRSAIWAALFIGIVTDLTWPITRADGGTLTIVGPYALGYTLGCQLVISLRGMVMARNPLTLVVLTILASVVAQILLVAVLAIRSGYDPVAFAPLPQLGARVIGSLMTGATALALSLVLIPLSPLLGVDPAHPRHR